MNFLFKCTALTAWLLLAVTDTEGQHLIHGTILNNKGEGVAAICTLMNMQDSTTITSTVSDSKGTYEINTAQSMEAILHITAKGYGMAAQRVHPTAQNEVVNFVLSPQKKLEEVTVTARKQLIEQKEDRTIFNVENSIAAIGGDALDALKKTPGVHVVNNEVTIEGKGTVSIMLNGRLQQVSGSDLVQLLRAIPSANLAKIEVITTPPARYDAEGDGGIINLVTKKNLKQGLNGSITAMYNRNSYNSGNVNAAANYRTGKLNIFANGNIGSETFKYTNKGSSYYGKQVWYQEIHQRYTTDAGRGQLGSEYSINKASTLGMTYTFNTGIISTADLTSAAIFNRPDYADSTANTKADARERGNNHTLNLNYEWRIDTSGKKLNVDADYYTQQSRKAKDFHIRHYLADETPTAFTSDYRITSRPTLDIKSIKTDVEWPVKAAVVSFGAKASFVDKGIANVFESQAAAGYVVDTLQTNQFQYTEQTQALYLSVQSPLGNKWKLQAGLRAEHTHTKGYSPTIATTNERDYTRLFPTLYVQYKTASDDAISFSYNRRIKRPDYNFLNPFRSYYSLNSYTVGNPDLQPSYVDRFLISYLLKSRYTIQAYTSYVSNYWDRIAIVDPTALNTGFTRANIGSVWYYGASISAALQPTAWWELHGSINGQYSDFKLTYYSNGAYNGYNGWLDGNSSFFLNKKKTLSAEIGGSYYTPRQKDYKRWEEMSVINVGIRAQLLDKKLTIALNADDLFAKSYWYQTNLVNGTTEYSYDDERAVRLAVTYKFGNKQVKSARQREAAEELQRIN